MRLVFAVLWIWVVLLSIAFFASLSLCIISWSKSFQVYRIFNESNIYGIYASKGEVYFYSIPEIEVRPLPDEMSGFVVKTFESDPFDERAFHVGWKGVRLRTYKTTLPRPAGGWNVSFKLLGVEIKHLVVTRWMDLQNSKTSIDESQVSFAPFAAPSFVLMALLIGLFVLWWYGRLNFLRFSRNRRRGFSVNNVNRETADSTEKIEIGIEDITK